MLLEEFHDAGPRSVYVDGGACHPWEYGLAFGFTASRPPYIEVIPGALLAHRKIVDNAHP